MACVLSLKNKILKKGAEAPAAKVVDVDGNEHIIGMIAINVQLIVALKSLDDRYCLEALRTLDTRLAEYKKLNLSVVVNENIENFLANSDFKKVFVYNDRDGQFQKRFGVVFEDGTFCNAFFVIDKEGELKMVKYLSKDAVDLDIEDVVQTTIDWVNYKPKGHMHENWMM